MAESPARPNESELERLDRNFTELLQGFRVAVTGVQVLFAFLLTVPFSVGFGRVEGFGRWLFVTALLSAAVSSVCFIAPAAQHRILFRTGSKEILVRRANTLGIWGTAALTLSIASGATLVAETFFSSWLAGGVAALVIGLCAWMWFLQPWLTVRKDRSTTDGVDEMWWKETKRLLVNAPDRPCALVFDRIDSYLG